MSGVAGKISQDPRNAVPESWVRRALDLLHHRGAEDAGVVVLRGAVLGCCRGRSLGSTTPVRQPLLNEDASLYLVFDGEIHGAAEHRHRLAGKGHHFRSSSDGEVLLHLYEEEGRELLHRLRGSFAFVLFEARTRRVFAATDRFGEHPLYYFAGPENFLFASSLAALLDDPEVEAEPDSLAVGEFVRQGFISSDRTGIRGVRKLPAGHFLALDRGRLQVQRYWALRPEPRRRGTRDDLAHELLWRLADAVRHRVDSGSELAVVGDSYGSHLTMALLARLGVRSIEAWSVMAPGARHPSNLALPLQATEEIAHHFGLHHEKIELAPPTPEQMLTFAARMDEPSASVLIPSWFGLCARLGRSHKLAFAGTAALGLATLPARPRRNGPLGSIAQLFLPRPLHPWGRRPSLLRDERHQVMDTWVIPKSILTVEFSKFLTSTELESDDSLGAHGTGTIEHWVQEELPVREVALIDRAAVCADTRVKLPFLDPAVVELMVTLPSRQGPFAVLRTGVFEGLGRKLLPPWLSRNHNYAGELPAPPLGEWLRGPLRALVFDLLLARRAASRAQFEPQAVRAMLEELRTGRPLHTKVIWTLLLLELWQLGVVDRCQAAKGWRKAS